MDHVEYQVSAKGIIEHVGGSWDNFALTNESPHLTSANVVGRNIFSFIKGDGVIHVYRTIHDLLARGERRDISFSYRCDGPSTRRDMRMTIRFDNSSFLYESVVVKSTPVAHRVEIDYSSKHRNTAAMCSFCKRFRYPIDSPVWNPLNAILENVPEPFSISHGVCEECSKIFYPEP